MMNVPGEGKVTEILAYLREKDAAERQLQRQLSGVDWWNGLNWQAHRCSRRRNRRGYSSALCRLAVEFRVFQGGENPGLVPLGMMVACWVAGGVIAWLIVRSSRNKKNDSPPVA